MIEHPDYRSFPYNLVIALICACMIAGECVGWVVRFVKYEAMKQ